MCSALDRSPQNDEEAPPPTTAEQPQAPDEGAKEECTDEDAAEGAEAPTDEGAPIEMPSKKIPNSSPEGVGPSAPRLFSWHRRRRLRARHGLQLPRRSTQPAVGISCEGVGFGRRPFVRRGHGLPLGSNFLA